MASGSTRRETARYLWRRSLPPDPSRFMKSSESCKVCLTEMADSRRNTPAMIRRTWKEKRSPLRAAGTVLFCCIRMYGGFADAEFLRGGADCGPVFDDVLSQALRPVLHVTLQSTTLPASCWFSLCGGNGGYDEKRKFPSPQSGETGIFQVRPLRAGLFFFGAGLAQPAGREPGF